MFFSCIWYRLTPWQPGTEVGTPTGVTGFVRKRIAFSQQVVRRSPYRRYRRKPIFDIVYREAYRFQPNDQNRSVWLNRTRPTTAGAETGGLPRLRRFMDIRLY